ncbi:hypothetical protein J6590_028521 [Homalodisca vitripennis]|nr:hypothetical protein J6590_028521 [Homalodisca vitripennis]
MQQYRSVLMEGSAARVGFPLKERITQIMERLTDLVGYRHQSAVPLFVVAVSLARVLSDTGGPRRLVFVGLCPALSGLLILPR